MIIAHRGNNKENLKENTKDAIINCLNKPYIDGVEFDIRLTKDKKIVLNHGPTYNGKIIKYTKSSKLKLDKLTTVLKNIKSIKYIIIDIKDNSLEIIDILYKVLLNYKHLNILIQSFNKNLIYKFKKKYPNIKLGIIVFKADSLARNIDFISIYYKNYTIINKLTFLWTVNSIKKLKELYNLNLNIITDNSWAIKKPK